MLGLLLLQVLASCLWLGHSEVVRSFAGCSRFFYNGSPPNNVLEPQNPAWICQSYSNAYRFATLYDKDRRIPVYSAYIYQPGSGKRPHTWWFVEPQLVGKNKIGKNLKEMERESVLIDQHKFTIEEIKESQAVLDDYNKMTGFDRGHLSPSGHLDSRESKTATFTLTNIVPQDSSLNSGQWNIYEAKTMPKMAKGCTTTYVITGAVPGQTSVVDGRVNVPSYIWSAACCVGKKDPMKAWGAIAENNKDKVDTLKLGELEARLGELYGGRPVTLFDNGCPRQKDSHP